MVNKMDVDSLLKLFQSKTGQIRTLFAELKNYPTHVVTEISLLRSSNLVEAEIILQKYVLHYFWCKVWQVQLPHNSDKRITNTYSPFIHFLILNQFIDHSIKISSIVLLSIFFK